MTTEATTSNSDSLYFYAEQFAAFAQETLYDVLPFKLALSALFSTIQELFPKILHDDDLNDKDGEDFLVRPGNVEDITNKIIEKRVTFASVEDQATYASSLKTTFSTMLKERLEFISSLTLKMGISRPVDYVISLGGHQNSPYTSIGDRYSIGDPIIQAAVPPMLIGSQVTGSAPQLSPEAAKARQEFAIAHEMAHIAQGDYFVRIAAITGMAALNIALWTFGMGLAASLATRIVSTVLSSIAFQGAARLGYTVLERHQEKKADILAMKALNTSEGAIIFFSSLKNNPRDLHHPLISERLAYSKQFKPL